MKTNDTCRLCHIKSQLKESHIIPRSIIKLVRDKKMNNKFYELGIDTRKIIQDGPKEYLLCNPCEQKIGRYEKYFKESIYLERHKIKTVLINRCFIFNNLNYSSIKLFLLSALWRMSISSLYQFGKVSLEDDEDQIRKLINEENPGKSTDYPIVGIVPLINGRREEAWMCFPLVDENKNIYCMIIGGVLYMISKTQHDPYFSKWLLNETGNWIMPSLDFYKIPFLKDLVDNIFR